MAIDFEALKNKAASLAQSSMAKAKELTEIGKLKMQNVSEQENIRRAYREIGKLYYEQHRQEPGEAFADLCKKIDGSNARIEYNNERIADLKAAGSLSDEDVAAVTPEEPEAPAAPETPEAPAGDDSSKE